MRFSCARTIDNSQNIVTINNSDLKVYIIQLAAFTPRVNKSEHTMILLLWLYILFHLSCCLVHCQHLEWDGTEINNNSVIYYWNATGEPL